jgi:hypothetical protein
MELVQTTLDAIQRGMDEIKKDSGGAVATNYFKQPMTGGKLLAVRAHRTLIFINDDSDFFRLYFYSGDASELARAMKGIDLREAIVIDYLAQEPDERILDAFREAGFNDYAVFVRLSNFKLKAYPISPAMQCAAPEDLEPLWARLLEFDKFTDHFPDKPTLLNLIQEKQVILNKKAGAIQGYIISRVMGTKANMNYFYNRSDDPRDTLLLLHSLYGTWCERGVRSGVAWVNATNVRVLKLHSQFGWQEDGLKDFIFRKLPNACVSSSSSHEAEFDVRHGKTDKEERR